MFKQILVIVCNGFCNIAIKEIRQNYTISQHYAQDWKSQVSCDGKSFRYLHEIIILYHIMIKWPNTKCDCTLTCQGSLIWCGLPNYIRYCPDTVGPEVWACSQAGVDSTSLDKTWWWLMLSQHALTTFHKASYFKTQWFGIIIIFFKLTSFIIAWHDFIFPKKKLWSAKRAARCLKEPATTMSTMPAAESNCEVSFDMGLLHVTPTAFQSDSAEWLWTGQSSSRLCVKESPHTAVMHRSIISNRTT